MSGVIKIPIIAVFFISRIVIVHHIVCSKDLLQQLYIRRINIIAIQLWTYCYLHIGIVLFTNTLNLQQALLLRFFNNRISHRRLFDLSTYFLPIFGLIESFSKRINLVLNVQDLIICITSAILSHIINNAIHTTIIFLFKEIGHVCAKKFFAKESLQECGLIISNAFSTHFGRHNVHHSTLFYSEIQHHWLCND